MATTPNEGTVAHALTQLKARDAENAPPQETEETEEELFEPPNKEAEEEEQPVDTAEETEDELFDQEPDGDEPAEDDPPPTLDAPSGFNAEEREMFAALPVEAQQAVIRRETARNQGVQKQLSEVQAAREAYERGATEAQQNRDRYAELLKEQIATSADVQEPREELLDPDSDEYDPERYQLQDLRYRKAQRNREQKLGQLQEIEAQQLQERDNALKQERIRSSNILVERYPEWKDKNVFQANIKEIRDYISGPSYNIPRQVADNVFDADMLTIAEKAMKFDRLQKDQKKIKKAPKQVRSAGQPRARTPKTAEAMAAHKKTGTVDSALAALKASDATRRRA